ncbi:ComEC/Rec2 family competence protein [Mycoplasma sp. P36-A1]|uniref:ComEC/Rec2 family competence protein n=1 Tax=Mycoplasma sp. P36-A1 TaxID=3252900 RepID=UPI003C303EB4
MLITLLINIFIIYKIKKQYVLITIITIFLLIITSINIKIDPPKSSKYHVIKVNNYDYTIKSKESTIILKTKKQLFINDEIIIKGNYTKINSISNSGLFNYSEYLKTKKIFYEIRTDDITIVKSNQNKMTKTSSQNKVNSYFDYLYFADKTNIDKEIVKSLSSLGIIHIFVVSGMHFNTFYTILSYLLIFIKNQKLHQIIIFVILFYYCYKLEFPIPAFKALFVLLLNNIKLTKNLYSLTKAFLFIVVLILVNPYLLIGNSFILSGVATIAIEVLKKYQIKNKLYQNFVTMLIMIPIISNMNYHISIFSFILNYLFSYFIIIVYLIIALAKIIEPIQEYVIILIQQLEKVLINLNDYNFLINSGYLTLTSILGYYVLLNSSLKKKNLRIKLIFIIYTIILLSGIKPYLKITYLNIGQGDTIIIQAPFTKCALMIDPGQPYKASTIKNITYPYLQSQSISCIEKIVISHDDLDHSGGLEDLKKLIEVKKVVSKKQEIIKYAQYTFVDVLHNDKFKDKNANSITMYSRMHNYNFMFTGDIDAKAEAKIYTKVVNLPIDILKVAHHGSKTSTSNEFLNLTKPAYAIISSGLNNRYKHPHETVIDSLNKHNIKIYNTAYNGNIDIYMFFKWKYIKTYK